MFVAPRPEDWLIFHGPASPAEARLYVQANLPAAPERLKLRGVIRGPVSQYARTLPASITLQTPVGGELFAEAILPDPCFWSPALPYLYTAEVQFELDGAIAWSDRRVFGIRRLGMRGRRLYFDAQNWVLRAGHVESVNESDWNACREQDLALVVDDPPESLCAEADRRGVLLVAQCPNDSEQDVDRRARWQRHASIGLIVIDADANLPLSVRSSVPNAIFAAQLSSGAQRVPQWADALWMPAELLRDREPFADRTLPQIVIAESDARSPHELRAACDALQLELAGRDGIAGYVAIAASDRDPVHQIA